MVRRAARLRVVQKILIHCVERTLLPRVSRQGYRRKRPTKNRIGEWLSLVEHLLREQGVGGSNPLSPTIVRSGVVCGRTPETALPSKSKLQLN